MSRAVIKIIGNNRIVIETKLGKLHIDKYCRRNFSAPDLRICFSFIETGKFFKLFRVNKNKYETMNQTVISDIRILKKLLKNNIIDYSDYLQILLYRKQLA